MLSADAAQRILDEADEVCPAAEVIAAVARIAAAVNAGLAGTRPLVLAVMEGAVVFAGHLLPRLCFPLEFEHLHVGRYGGNTTGATLHWLSEPRQGLDGRTILVLDDVLDEGITLAAIRERLLERGAAAVYTAVLVNKLLAREKAIAADFVGIELPDRYLFGFGMDVGGAWRNLPAIHALRASPKEEQ